MRFFKTCLLLAGILFAPSILAKAETGIGAEFDMGYSTITGDGSSDSKAENGFDIKKIDVFFRYNSKNTKAVIQADFAELNKAAVNPVTGADGQTATDANNNPTYSNSFTGKVLDDAWISYEFMAPLKIKWGIETTNSIDPTTGSQYTTYSRINRSEEMMVEFSGKVGGASYGLQVWEDTPADQSVDDQDSASNWSLAVGYGKGDMSYRAVYVNDAAVTGVKKKTGYTLSVEFARKRTAYYAVYTSLKKNEDQEKGVGIFVGGSLRWKKFSIHFTVDMLDPVATKGQVLEQSTATNFTAEYDLNDNLSYQLTFVNYGENYGNTKVDAATNQLVTKEAYSLAAIGIKGRY